jgi:NADPH:quinone reductase-like Zn-dependent oxidoreductase
MWSDVKAAVYRRYGPPEVVSIEEVPKPVPARDEVLVRVRATTVASGDWRLRSLDVPGGFGMFVRLAVGITGPRKRVLGTEIAGDVESVGANVTRFAVGDRVFALTGTGLGGHAEYRAMRETAAIARIPPTLSYEQASALSFGGTTALYYVRDLTKVRPGETVLINGASGAVGSAAVQLARHFGAVVTGVCSAANADLVRSIGATDVIDYEQQDFTQAHRTWDVIVDTVGNVSFASCVRVLAPNGRLGLVVGTLGQTIGASTRPTRSGRRVFAGISPERAEDLRVLAELAEAGAYLPVIDRVYPFARIVEAHAHVETHHKKGNVVVTL